MVSTSPKRMCVWRKEVFVRIADEVVGALYIYTFIHINIYIYTYTHIYTYIHVDIYIY